ncbi:signal peptidase II [Thalassiella azotivora]
MESSQHPADERPAPEAGPPDRRPGTTDAAAPVGDPPRRSRRRLHLVTWSIVAVVYVLDQVTKWLAVEHLTDREPVQVVGELVQLRLVYNPGAAFSIGTSMTWLLTLLATVVVVVVVRVSRRLGSRAWAVAFGLLLAGALGNLTDRFLRDPGFARGHVVDFVALPDFPVFNVADSSITVAACLVILLGLRGIGVDGGREGDSAADDGGATGGEDAARAGDAERTGGDDARG